NTVRPRAKHSILDSIFAEARARAIKENPENADAALCEIVLILLNRYKLQCRTAVRNFYASDRFDKPSLRWASESGNAPVGTEESDGPRREKFDTIATHTSLIPTEQKREFMEIARESSARFFPDLTNSQKAGLYAQFARNNAGEKLRYNDPKISDFVDVGQAQFYEGRKKAIHTLIETFRSTSTWEGEDEAGRTYLEQSLEETLLDESFEWFRRKKPELFSSTR
ncbi:MAG: hypothetical protein AAF357_20090, partial [Verrucomicrobiota bacterium]